MKVKENTCPSCGAQLKIDRFKLNAKCDYCGSEFTLEDLNNETIKMNDRSHVEQEKIREEKANSTEDYDYGIFALMSVIGRVLDAIKGIVGTVLLIIVLLIIAFIITRIL